jgi:hypothetical protein
MYAFTCHYKNRIKNTEWLVGTWENITSRGIIYETWKKNSATELEGMSYAIKERDTMIFEKIRLVQERDSMFYIPIIKDQNNSLPTKFSEKLVSETKLVFQNLNHDFPQIISYTKINDDSLVAEISGLIKGKERKQSFPMKRKN